MTATPVGQEDSTPYAGLRANSLSMPMVIALGLAYMSLAPALYFNFGLISSSAGKPAAPIIYLIVTVAIIPTAISFAQLSKQRPTAGSASVWVGESLGHATGIWTGWLQTSLYAFGCAIYPAYFSIFFNPFLEYFGINVSYLTSALASVGICLIVAYLMQHSISLSAKHILWLMATEASFVLGLSVFIAIKQTLTGHNPHPLAPFSLSGATGGSSGIIIAVVFGVLSIAGVDSIAPVAEETREPKRLIPRATIIVTIAAGVFWTIAAYGYSIAIPFKSLVGYVDQGLVTPIYPIAADYIGPLRILVPITGFTAVLAGFGATAVCASRLLFNLGRSGHVHRSLGITHPRHGSPWNASKPILLFATIAPIVAGLALGHNASNAAAWWGGVFVYFALVTYLLVNVANIAWHFQHRRADFSWLANGVVPVAGAIIIVFMLYKFFDVYLAGPFSTGSSIVYFSLLWTVVGAVWASLLWRRSHSRLIQSNPVSPGTKPTATKP